LIIISPRPKPPRFAAGEIFIKKRQKKQTRCLAVFNHIGDFNTVKIIDISQEVLSSEVYPGDPKPEGEKISSIEDGELYNLSRFSMCAHNGTHIDAPSHFDVFVGDCSVIYHKGNVTAEDARAILQKAADTGASERILISGDAVVTAEAGRVFAESGIKLIGNESQTVGPEDAPAEVHKILLGAGIILLEGVALKNVAEGKYFLNAAPLNLAGFEGSPCRAYLIEV
jgi:arylformamidase